MIEKRRIFLSTMADAVFDGTAAPNRISYTMDSALLARAFGLGLEFAEYCTASNMDENFDVTDAAVRAKIKMSAAHILHGPFNELCPAAIDPLVLDLTKRRYAQAVRLAVGYGIGKIVIHSGYIPQVYDKSWFHDRSVDFWRAFLEETPGGVTIVLENVMEDEPGLLAGIVREVNDPGLRLCLDVGHANLSFSRVPLSDWLESYSGLLSHLHLHNNRRERDLHGALGDGGIDMARLLGRCEQLCPGVTYTIETVMLKESLLWLAEGGFLDTGGLSLREQNTKFKKS